MATPDLAATGANAPDLIDSEPKTVATRGVSKARHLWGLVGQYAFLSALALVVLGPLLLTVIQAMSPPFAYVLAGKPLHPIEIDWKDRTWFSGGLVSAGLRTLVVVGFFAWIQRIAAGVTWKQWRRLVEPARLVSIVAPAVGLMVLLGPTYQSLHASDGKSQWWILATMAVVAATLMPGLLAGATRGIVGSVAGAAALGVIAVGVSGLFVGGAVWTQAWGSANLGPAMRQSLIMAVLITAMQVVTSITSAYAFVFLNFPLKRLLFALFMVTMLLPLEVTLVGNVALIRQLGWINSMQGLVLPFGATALGTFLIRQGFRGIPPEIQDACRLDGYGHISFLTKFAVPLSRPVIAAFTVISALGAWNQYLWPRAVIDNDKYSTLQIQLRTIVGENVANANVSIAAALVAALPVLVLLVAFQRQIIRGLTAGAVK
ncbi:MAG: carbohydrate ABC transporter permease [Aquihabitans sp.]